MTLVSVVDNNVIHINSLLALFTSLQASNSNFKDIYVLTLPGHLPVSCSNYFNRIGIKILVYNICDSIMENDPYRVKYLLTKFIENNYINTSHIMYLDPDHIAFNKIIIENTDILKVSSEVKDVIDTFLLDKKFIKHFNTSIMFSSIETFKAATVNWLDQYNQIKGRIDVRFREEIALGLSANIAQIDVQPLEINIQCTIESIDANSSLCHYGGTSNEALTIKNCLNQVQINDVLNNLHELRANYTCNNVKYICDQLIKNFNIVRQYLD